MNFAECLAWGSLAAATLALVVSVVVLVVTWRKL